MPDEVAPSGDAPQRPFFERRTHVLTEPYAEQVSSAGASGRVDSLTGLRIIAAAAVFFSHLHPPEFIPARVTVFMDSGYSGVTIFFVLSGFVLAWNYTERLIPLSARAVWSFAVARFARIYPLYVCVLIWVCAPGIVDHLLPDGTWLHFLALQTWHPDLGIAFGLNGPGWSIGVEFFLYALFPLLIVAIGGLRDNPRLLLVVGLVAIALVGALTWWFSASGRGDLSPLDPTSAHRWLYRTPVTRIGDFTIGIVAALLIRSMKVRPWLGTASQVVALVILLAMMASSTVNRSTWSWDFAYLVPTGLLLWGLASNPGTVIARALGSRPMVFAGEASFAFYLLHLPLLQVLVAPPTDGWYGWAFVTGLQFGVILLTAVGAHIVIERPAQQYLRRALDRRRPTVITGASPSEGVAPTRVGQLPALGG